MNSTNVSNDKLIKVEFLANLLELTQTWQDTGVHFENGYAEGFYWGEEFRSQIQQAKEKGWSFHQTLENLLERSVSHLGYRPKGFYDDQIKEVSLIQEKLDTFIKNSSFQLMWMEMIEQKEQREKEMKNSRVLNPAQALHDDIESLLNNEGKISKWKASTQKWFSDEVAELDKNSSFLSQAWTLKKAMLKLDIADPSAYEDIKNVLRQFGNPHTILFGVTTTAKAQVKRLTSKP